MILNLFKPNKTGGKSPNIILSKKDSEDLLRILNETRNNKEWTEQRLFDKAGIAKSTYYNMKKGYYSIDFLTFVFKALEIDVDDEIYERFIKRTPKNVSQKFNRHTLVLLSALLVSGGVSLVYFAIPRNQQIAPVKKQQTTIQVKKSDSPKPAFSAKPETQVQPANPINQRQVITELKNAGGSLVQVDIETMLRDGNVELLKLASKAGLKISQIEAALRKHNTLFFKAIKRDEVGNDWFAEQLSNGLNPELRVLMNGRDEASILNAAIAGENLDASVALIKAGASPHFYQELQTKRHTTPSFLFPLRSIVRFNRLSSSQKETLIATMIKHGAVFYQPIEMSTSKTPGQTGDGAVIDVTASMPKIAKFTKNKPLKIELSAAFKRNRLRCETATRVTGKNWCSVMDNVPTYIEVHDQRIDDIFNVYVQDMINVSDESAFFFVTHTGGYKSIYGLLEVTPDHDHYNLYLYGSRSGRGKGICEGKHGSDASSFCWQTWTVQKLSKETASINDYYEAKLSYPNSRQ